MLLYYTTECLRLAYAGDAAGAVTLSAVRQCFPSLTPDNIAALLNAAAAFARDMGTALIQSTWPEGTK